MPNFEKWKIEEVGDASNGKAVKIVSVENAAENRVKINVHKNELEKILLHEDVKDLNLAVLSVTGEARIGKSFYIDKFRRFLLAHQVSYRGKVHFFSIRALILKLATHPQLAIYRKMKFIKMGIM